MGGGGVPSPLGGEGPLYPLGGVLGSLQRGVIRALVPQDDTRLILKNHSFFLKDAIDRELRDRKCIVQNVVIKQDSTMDVKFTLYLKFFPG